MAGTVGDMTQDELRLMLESVVEQKLQQLLNDDDGLELREELRSRLSQQKVAVAMGERGRSLAEVSGELGLE